MIQWGSIMHKISGTAGKGINSYSRIHKIKFFNIQNKEDHKLSMVTPSHTQVSIKHLAKNRYYFNVYSVNKLVAFNNK